MQNHGILVYMECADGQPIKASLEALNAAGRLAAQTGKHVAAVLLDQADAASAVAAYGVETVLCAQVGGYQAESYAAALAELCGRYEADALLMGSTATLFYTMGLYFGHVKIKKSRYAVAAAMCADFVAIIMAVLLTKYL